MPFGRITLFLCLLLLTACGEAEIPPSGDFSLNQQGNIQQSEPEEEGTQEPEEDEQVPDDSTTSESDPCTHPQFLVAVDSQPAWSAIVEWYYLFTIVSIFVLGCMVVALQLPFIFKYGAEKGRIGYYVMIIAASAGTALSGNLMNGDQKMELSNGMVLLVLCIVAIVFYGLSWILSIRFYNKREID